MNIIIPNYFNNHAEGDSLVWLYVCKCLHGKKTVVIYATDTDIPHIGMGLIDKYLDRHMIIQIRESFNSEYLDLNKLTTLMLQNVDLSQLTNHVLAHGIQTLFIVSGCDYASFFQHFTKANFYNAYADNIQFISFKDSGSLSQTNSDDWHKGLLAF